LTNKNRVQPIGGGVQIGRRRLQWICWRNFSIILFLAVTHMWQTPHKL